MTLTPLITAAEGFPALEQLCNDAQDELVMSFRILDPRTKLRTPELRAKGLENWADLLADVARRGVKLRMIISDFDPVFTSTLHRNAWRSASAFAERLQGDDAQILCAPHGQNAGWLWRMAMRGPIARHMEKLRQEEEATLTPVQRTVLKGAVALRPVTIHQKFAVADGKAAVIGGLDINERRFDTPEHDRPADETWHDVSMRVDDADFAAALRHHFGECWNAALDCDTPCLTGRTERFDTAKKPQAPADLRVVRTFSAPCSGPARLSPRAAITEHEKAVIAMIGEAERYIYIETQFLRHRPVAEALAKAGERSGELQLVVLMPSFPDRVLYEGNDGWDTRHGHALQTEAVDRVSKAFGDRAAFVSPGQHSESPEDIPDLLGSGPIYVHSKVTLVDDRVGLVGSANLNGRSLRWDTEASVMFRRSDAVEDLQRRLASTWLGDHLNGHDRVSARTWRQAALANAAHPPQDREGFVLPYPQAEGRKFAKSLPVLPADMF
ncbi:phospholipase D family protein [Alloyangia pacifica]|uniref:phospholipase D family protein n=1 Tax=Alloyangia pacifica TaxID=311180 RepID=UPI001CD42615|nr:phospholipase D-like domain-containing protein [Alloyangia pacifica]MCA0997897.1 phospholipase D-like domain-containing protein [Alloyangia pacifica]